MTLANLTAAIKQLEAINPLDEYAYEKAIMAYLTISKLPILICEIPEGLYICRTRTHITPSLFENIQDISTPPYRDVKNFARCNRPYQSKFYGSETRPTSFIELADNWAETKNVGDILYVTIGLWITKMPLFSIIVTTPDVDNRISEFDKHHGKALDDFIGKYDGEFKDAMLSFYRFLFDWFRKSAKHDPLTYIITSAYCNLAFAEGKGQANSILYPSVPFGGQGVNFAINADFISPENIELQNAMCNEMTISKNENNMHSFTESNSWTAKDISIAKNEIKW